MGSQTTFGTRAPDGTWVESRSPSSSEKVAQVLSRIPISKIPGAKSGLRRVDQAISFQSRIFKIVAGAVSDRPKLTQIGFSTAVRVLKTLGARFEDHKFLDTHNPAVGDFLDDDITNSYGERVRSFDHSVFVPGSLTINPLAQGIQNRISSIAKHASVMENVTAHVDDVSVLSSAYATAERLRSMVGYVQPDERVLLIGHSLGGVIIDLALAQLTPAEQAAILNWQLHITTVGSPQLNSEGDQGELMEKTIQETGLLKPLDEMVNDARLQAQLGKKTLAEIVRPWQKNGFESLTETKLTPALREKHSSFIMEHDAIVSDDSAKAPLPGTNKPIKNANHFTAIFLDSKKWRAAMGHIGDMDRKLGYTQ